MQHRIRDVVRYAIWIFFLSSSFSIPHRMKSSLMFSTFPLLFFFFLVLFSIHIYTRTPLSLSMYRHTEIFFIYNYYLTKLCVEIYLRDVLYHIFLNERKKAAAKKMYTAVMMKAYSLSPNKRQKDTNWRRMDNRKLGTI